MSTPTLKTPEATTDADLAEQLAQGIREQAARDASALNGASTNVTFSNGAKPTAGQKTQPRYSTVKGDNGRWFVHDAETGDLAAGTKRGFKTKAEGIAKIRDLKAKAATKTPKPEPQAEEPRHEIRAPKQKLALAVVRAAASVVGDSLVLADTGLTEAEAGAIVANWLHCLPTGRDEKKQRIWVDGLPTPEHRDWA
jgi:hypothetical protein